MSGIYNRDQIPADLMPFFVRAEIGLEPTLPEFIAALVETFDLCRQVLADDGTAWVNMGDSYLPGKQLAGQPWRLAFALQDAGWYLRQDIIWSKPNPMPESVRDRCTKSHEYVFLLSKSDRYYFDQDAILEPVSPNTHARLSQNVAAQIGSERANGGAKTNGNMKAVSRMPDKRNRRSVWNIPTESYSDAHFATFPRALVEPCILAGSRVGDIVFDPFLGSGTTAQVAQALGRHWIGCELNPEYVKLQKKRTSQLGLILEVA